MHTLPDASLFVGGEPGPATVTLPVIRERWRNIVRERENVHYGPQRIFMTLYGRKPRGGGSGCCLAVSLTCDLETGSVVVQKRSEEGEKGPFGCAKSELC